MNLPFSTMARLAASTLALAAALAAGCSRDPSLDAADSDANGYVCRACSERFHTSRDVFAEKCPKCASLNLGELTGYFCAADGQITIAPREQGAARCQKCGNPAHEIKLPRAKDFQAAGVAKQEKRAVLISK